MCFQGRNCILGDLFFWERRSDYRESTGSQDKAAAAPEWQPSGSRNHPPGDWAHPRDPEHSRRTLL